MIRPFQPEDASHCYQVIRSCIECDASLTERLREGLLRAESPQSIQERARLFYVAVYDSGQNILGLGGLDLNEIRLLSVSPAHQGQGIGCQILRHLEAMVPPALFTDIFVYAALSAEGFYLAQGYTSRGSHEIEVLGLPMPTIFMSKLIPQSRRANFG